MSPTENARDLYTAAAGLLVDLDGTLVDSSAPVNRAWAGFAARQGLDLEAVMAVAHGRPSRETVQEFAPAAEHDAETRELEQAECSDTAGTFALPGAADVLASERPLAIVTSCSARLASVRLAAAGLTAPEIVVSADDVLRGKPDPECFLIGARRLGLPPAECLVLEDSPAGIAAAVAAGIDVIAVRSTHDGAALDGAAAVVSDLGELVSRPGRMGP